jgi:hypothetical protein
MTSIRIVAQRLSALLAVLALVACFSAGQAWASATSGTVKGTVIDDGGLAIPGALVTLKSPTLIGGAQQRTTDDDGAFSFVELSPGAYEITAQKQGFGAQRKTGLQVAIGRTLEITIELKYGGETITVEAERKVVDTESTTKETTFTKDFLQMIPTGRTYQDVVGNASGVIGFGGNPYSGGASNDENTYLLDGVNITDPVTGTFSLNFNFDAIEEIQVITGAFDPEYGTSLGAVISTVTSSGSNTLETIANAFYLNGDWGPKTDARYAPDGYELSPTGFDESAQTYQLGVVTSGPIVKDRVWFLGSYEYDRTLYSAVGIDLPRDFDGHYFFGKLTTQPTSAHRITLSASTNPTTIDNLDQGDRFTEASAQPRQYQGGYTASLKWNWFINPDTNLETSGSVLKEFIDVTQVPCTHDDALGYNPCQPGEAENTIDFDTPSRQGLYGAFSSQNFSYFYIDDRDSYELSTKFSILNVDFKGKHDIKIGVAANYLAWDLLYGYPGNLQYVDLYENSFDPTTLKNFYYLEYPGTYEYLTDGYHVGAFIQDVYKPISNLTFRYGVRYDRAVNRNDAGEPIVDVGVFGPRAYASWDPWGDEKTKIYGGYGRFNDTGRLDIAYYLSQSSPGVKLTLGEYFGGDTSSVDNVYYDYNNSNYISVWEKMAAPHSDEFSLGAEREIITDVKAGLDFTAKFTESVYSFDELNLIYDEDGYTYVGTRDGTDDFLYRLRTPTIARRDYFQTDVSLEKVYADRWLGQGTYSYVVSRGTTQYATTASLANPAQVAYAYGNLPTDLRHQVKLYGGWKIPDDPWTTTIGFQGQYYSGSPITRYYYAQSGQFGYGEYSLLQQPVGTYGRENEFWTLSLLLQQDIPVDKGALGATLQVDNLTNNQYAYYYNSYYIAAENRIVIGARQDIIQAQVGLKYKF